MQMNHAAIRRALSLLLPIACLVLPAALSAEEIPWEWSGVDKIIVIGDLHGDYESFIRILKGTEVIDPDLHWAAGKAHFVQMGDIMDRGIDARKILDDLMRLEKEAEAAGGMVHVLLGNHEELNLTGIVFSSNLDYVTLDQFIKFLPDGYRKKQEEALAKKLLRLSARDRETSLKESNDRYRTELVAIWREFQSPGLQSSFRPMSGPPSIVYRGDSPLWYRELATVPEEDLKEELDMILAPLAAKAMVIAHTPRIPSSPKDMQRFGGRVWIVDTGISRAYGGPASALIILDGYFNVWGVGDENDKRGDRARLDLRRAGTGHPDPVPAGP